VLFDILQTEIPAIFALIVMKPKPNLQGNTIKSGFTFQDVWEVVKLVPYGRVTTYGAIAKYLGSGRSSQMVGMATNAAHGKDVPAHRVVNRNGLLTGAHHFGSPTKMQELLAAEGVMVKDNTVQDFAEKLWNPMELEM